MGLANELFKPINAGLDITIGILNMMNTIKTQQEVPHVIKQCNITSIYKKKGSKKSFLNCRGIFRVTILRSILDKLIYNDVQQCRCQTSKKYEGQYICNKCNYK